MNPQKIRIVIVDDDALIRQTMSLLLGLEDDLEVVATGSHGGEASILMKKEAPDVLLLDMRMEPEDGISALKKMSPEERSKVLVLSTFDEDRYVISAINLGAAGYILKNAKPEEIIRAIRQIACGQNVLGPEAMGKIRQTLQQHQTPKGETKTSFQELSPRELEVSEQIAQGLSNKEIAEKLFLSEGTVKNHISSILAKTQLSHRTQIAIAWLKQH